MVRRCRLPAGLDVQLISSKPRLVQMWRTGPRGAPQSTRTVAVAMRALIDTWESVLLACGLSQDPPGRECSGSDRKDTPMSDHDGVEPVPETSSHHVSRRGVLRAGLVALTAAQLPDGLVSRALAQGAKPGANLIGKLEGAEVVTDPARYPKTFKEAPQLAELVKAGKLPPVQERIGQDPLVVKPLREIGKYGGTWRRGFTGPFDTSNGHRAAQNDKLLFFDYTGTRLVPNIARGWEVSPDGKVTTVHLRRGMKWSDGHPFTADDFVFWFEDVYSNKEIVPTPLSVMSINGKPIAVKKVDAITVQFVAPDPYYALPTVLASVWGIGHHARFGRDALGGFAPAHYLKQFLPKYASKDDLAKRLAEAKMDTWVLLLKNRNDACRNPDLPVVTPWKTVSPINTPTWILERNPYSVWVDTAGNQLPYIDRIRMTLGENLELINLRAIAGEYDSQARHIDISKLPVLLENQQRGNYRVHLDPSDQGADVGLFCNQSYEQDAEIAKWLGTRSFRIALSHGIDRAQINEVFVLGLGQTGSAAPRGRTPYLLRAPVGRRHHLRPLPPDLPRSGPEPPGAALRRLVLQRGRQGQAAAAAHARADGHLPPVVRRPRPGAHAPGQGRLEDRAGRALAHPRRLELARLAGRARDQEHRR